MLATVAHFQGDCPATEAVRLLEMSGLVNAGLGSHLTSEGVAEMEASHAKLEWDSDAHSIVQGGVTGYKPEAPPMSPIALA